VAAQDAGAQARASKRAVAGARGGRARSPDTPIQSTRAAAEARLRAQEAQIVALLNHHRAAHNLVPLELDTQLREVAGAHSSDMLRHDYFAHDDAHGTWDARIRRSVRRNLVGEILAFGSGDDATPVGLVKNWMQSQEHRRVILAPQLRRVGVGVATGTFRGRNPVSVATADFSSTS
jgi:uncharacterized protein YkwD